MTIYLIFKSILDQANLSVYLIAVFVIVIAWLYRKPKVYQLAPGPKGYPLLGHLPYLAKDPQIRLNEFRKLYGPVFSIKFGIKSGVVLGDFKTIKEVFRMDCASNRPPNTFKVSPHFNNVVELNGKEWVDRRRFAATVLRGANRERSTEDIIQEEVTRLLEALKKRDLSKDIETRKLLSIVANNVGFSIICGKSFDEDDPMTDFLLSFNHGLMGYFQWMPFAEALGVPKFVYRRIFPKIVTGEIVINQMDEFIKNEIIEHEQKLNPENPRDFIDFGLLELQKTGENKRIQGYEGIRGDCQLLLLGGTDTARVTMEWALLCLAQYPEIQERVNSEIVEVLGDRRPKWSDQSSLPYVHAFIMESQRFCTLVPINLMRTTSRDIKINGYDVPKDTWLFANLWAVHNDPDLWENPETFDPSRFLNKAKDKATEPEHWVPFSTGHRMCFGDKVAKMEIFVTLCNFIQHYRVSPTSNGVRFDGDLRLAYAPLYPEVRLHKRKSG